MLTETHFEHALRLLKTDQDDDKEITIRNLVCL